MGRLSAWSLAKFGGVVESDVLDEAAEVSVVVQWGEHEEVIRIKFGGDLEKSESGTSGRGGDRVETFGTAGKSGMPPDERE